MFDGFDGDLASLFFSCNSVLHFKYATNSYPLSNLRERWQVCSIPNEAKSSLKIRWVEGGIKSKWILETTIPLLAKF